MADTANHFFLPWVQPGLVANLPDAAKTLSVDHAAQISLTVKLNINTASVEKTAKLYGPGDVIGIDPQQVIRVEPKHRTTDFEPNYFPAIEFDRPDFPWLFTPTVADGQARLRPWLCLIVVRKQQGVTLSPGQPLPILNIKSPAKPGNELPDLAESHFWAHAQVTGASRAELQSVLESSPERTLSRLLSPRRLHPLSDYLACLVPTFEVGRAVGLGDSPKVNNLTPAWRSGSLAPDEVTLPVYYSWEFRTGIGSDFEELVRRLQPRELPQQVGKRPVDITRPGFLVGNAPATVLGLEGALRPVKSEPDPWPDASRKPFQAALAQIVNTPWEVATETNHDHDPLLAPPIYGCWHAAAHKVRTDQSPPDPTTKPAPPWLNELNLDPRHRIVAAMGTQVVQDQQEQLMASAWQQLGDIQKINQRLRQAQLSRAVNEKYLGKVFNRFSPETFLKVIAPAQSRLFVTTASPTNPNTPVRQLLSQKLSQSFVPTTAISAPLRRATSPTGPIGRRFVKQGRGPVGSMITHFNSASASASLTQSQPKPGRVTIADVSEAGLAPTARTKFQLQSLSASLIEATQPPPATVPFRDAAKEHQAFLSNAFITMIFHDLRKELPGPSIKTAAMLSLKPSTAVVDAVLVGSSFESPPLQTGDPLDPIMDAPSFIRPMYEALRDLSQDYLLPGLDHVPAESVQLLKTNAKFIESYMVGLNVEMGRELLWRNYPTDQRGTYFRQFWDTSGTGETEPDIIPIHQWRDRALGVTAGRGGDKLVLLIRGELLKRYPSAIIYAVKAIMHNGKRELATDHPGEVSGPLESFPIFRGTLEPDVTFLGFNLAPKDALAGDGWFFVIQQQPTEPRFGLDDDPFGVGESHEIPKLETWNDLNWAHLAPSADELNKLSYVHVLDLNLKETKPTKGKWGQNAAHMAHITKQLPVRVAIHATELIPHDV